MVAGLYHWWAMMDQRTGVAKRSWALYDRAQAVIPMGTQTHSKAPREALRGVEPCYIKRAKGCRVWDIDGNRYLDFRNAVGPITLGYNHPAVTAAVKRQLDDGTVFSYAHPLEVTVAERLTRVIPCAEQVRFLKTGGEAMAAAHRLARAHTGRDLILTCGYHGWVNTVNRPGVPEAISSVYVGMPWGDAAPYEAALDARSGSVAAISVACDYATIHRGHTFLRDLRRLCDAHGALLIFDEIVTGFRLRIGGAQEYFGVTPDLAVFAKGIANGFPLSCYAGRRDVVERVRDVGVSSTYGGEATSLAAADAVLTVYEQEPVIETLWARGARLHDGFGQICDRLSIRARIVGLPPCGVMVFDYDNRAALLGRLFGECLKRGLIFYTSLWYINYAHSEPDIDEALGIVEEALGAMREEGLFKPS